MWTFGCPHIGMAQSPLPKRPDIGPIRWLPAGNNGYPQVYPQLWITALYHEAHIAVEAPRSRSNGLDPLSGTTGHPPLSTGFIHSHRRRPVDNVVRVP